MIQQQSEELLYSEPLDLSKDPSFMIKVHLKTYKEQKKVIDDLKQKIEEQKKSLEQQRSKCNPYNTRDAFNIIFNNSSIPMYLVSHKDKRGILLGWNEAAAVSSIH